jgi:hypothetical protein
MELIIEPMSETSTNIKVHAVFKVHERWLFPLVQMFTPKYDAVSVSCEYSIDHLPTVCILQITISLMNNS